jgi:hypothetical protein
MDSLSSRKKSSALESATSTLFHKNIRGGYATLAESIRTSSVGAKVRKDVWVKLKNETGTTTFTLRLGPQLSSELAG